jgi:hypothetical protein
LARVFAFHFGSCAAARPTSSLSLNFQAEHLFRTEVLWRREALMVFGPDLDLAVRRPWITRSMCDEIKRLVKDRSDRYQVIEEWWDVGWVTRLARFLFFIGSGRLIEGRWCGPRLLPFRIFISLGAMWSRWRLATKDVIVRTISSLSCTLIWMCPAIDWWASSLAAL